MIKSSDAILKRFVSHFKLDCTSDWQDEGDIVRQQQTERQLLDQLYDRLPAKFPPLYERLVLSYRWQRADLDKFALLANPPGADLQGLEDEIFHDEFLTDVCLKHGFIPFGKAADYLYDPLCFDTRRARGKRNYLIVTLDHEQILCYERIKIVSEPARNFWELVESVL